MSDASITSFMARSEVAIINNMPQAGPRYRIAFIMNGAKPPRGGEYLVQNLIVNMDRGLFHPIVIYAEEGKIVKRLKEAGIESVQVPLRGGIAFFFPGEILRNPLKLAVTIFNYLRSRYLFKVIKALKDYDVDLIYSADSLSKVSGGISGWWLKIDVIAHSHVDFEGPLFRNMVGKLLKFIDTFFLDRIIAVSEKVRLCFEQNKIFPNVKTIYNGIDTDVFDPHKVDCGVLDELAVEKDAIKIGMIGTIERIKGHEYLLEAVAMLRCAGINCLVLICGEGGEDETIKKTAKDKSVGEYVYFLGRRDDTPRVLRVLDILIVPSLHESFSMVAIEAMSMEVPVIATRVGGLPEVVEDGVTGVLVRPGDARELCEAIRHLIENPQLRRRMGKNGRRRVLERFTIDENVRRTEEVFLELLEAQR